IGSGPGMLGVLKDAFARDGDRGQRREKRTGGGAGARRPLRGENLAYDKHLMAAIATTRLGLGARAGEIEAARSDPQGWLTAQIRPLGADVLDPAMPSSAVRFAEYRQFQLDRREARAA